MRNAFRLGQLMLALLACAATVLAQGTSGTADPVTADLLPVNLPRSQTQSRDGLTVQVMIPPAADAARIFGAPLAERGIQPVWLRLRNDTDFDFWLAEIALDADYYSPDEAAFVAGAKLNKKLRPELTRLMRKGAVPLFLARHSINEGYVYASYLRGGRYVDVRLAGPGHAERFRFAVLLPTQGFDYERSDLRLQYAKLQELPDLTIDELRIRLREELPCCTTTQDGTGQGDPLNIVLVGAGEDALAALISSGWSLTEAITADSVRRMVGAAIAEKSYVTAPVSSLYLFGRKQDLALQRGRSTISQRNHMRLWLAPYRCQGLPVWIGQVSRDIGVKMTSKSPTLTTHVIDPVVDESRGYLLQSLLNQESISQFGAVRGVGAATIDHPRFNLTGDPYFTDGNRFVMFLSREPVPIEQVLFIPWNQSSDPIRESRGEDSKVPIRP